MSVCFICFFIRADDARRRKPYNVSAHRFELAKLKFIPIAFC